MEALFIVPAMVSPQVNEKLIPALSKMIERNIILNNAALFRAAALKKYSRVGSWGINRESTEVPITVISDAFINENDAALHSFGKLIIEGPHGYDKKTHRQNKQQNQPSRPTPSQSSSSSQSSYNPPGQKGSASNLSRNLPDSKEDLEDLWLAQYTIANNKADTYDTSEVAAAARLQADITKKLSQLGYRPPSKNEAEKFAKDNDNPLDIEKLISDIQKNKVDIHNKNMSSAKIAAELKDRKANIKFGRKARSTDAETFNYSHTFANVDAVEHPTGIKFFSQISLEPTILNLSVTVGTDERVEQKIIQVGVKCVPYIIDDVTSIIKLLRESKNMNWFERQFKNAFRKINTKIWFTRRRAINKGHYINPDEAVESIMYSPSRDELTNTTALAKKFTSKDSSSWSTMIILSSYDLDENDALMDIVNNYRKLTKYVFGDLVITNETKESAYFCTPRLNHCQEIPFDYLKKVLNLKDVLDYSEASRASAWSKEARVKASNIRSAVSESPTYESVYNKIDSIVKGF